MSQMRVYIAGPYTKGDVAQNVRRAVLAADRLAQAGLVPYIPHLTHLWHLISPHPYEFWLEQTANWVQSCDILLRLPGESDGADQEVELAWKLGIPVYTNTDYLLKLSEEGEFKP